MQRFKFMHWSVCTKKKNSMCAFHLTMCFRATAGALVSQVKRRARATASARALDRAMCVLPCLQIGSEN